MKRRRPDSFKKLVDRILHEHGRSFQGIHLKCRRCGEEAFAASLKVAKLFGGWTKLRKRDGPHYLGFCIECSESNRKE